MAGETQESGTTLPVCSEEFDVAELDGGQAAVDRTGCKSYDSGC
jgi:hypothetical protein